MLFVKPNVILAVLCNNNNKMLLLNALNLRPNAFYKIMKD